MSRLTGTVSVALLLFVLMNSFHQSADDKLTPYPFPKLHFFPEMPVSPDNPVTVEGASLGRYLFYDTLLSKNYNLSCGSCHRQEAAFSDSPERFSDAGNGPELLRNTPPLFNLAWYPSYFWDGRAATIEDQVLHPIREGGEMNAGTDEIVNRLNNHPVYPQKFEMVFEATTIDSSHLAKALGQFLRTLISHNSKFDKVLRRELTLNKDEYDGFVLLNEQNKGNCLHCHTSDSDVLGTTAQFSNNGLDYVKNIHDFKDKGRGGITGNTNDYGRFKIPTLRNIVLTAPYMHDGRFNTIDEVLNFYNTSVQPSPTLDSKINPSKHLALNLTPDELEKMKSFLFTLTDSVFIMNPEFSNPYLLH